MHHKSNETASGHRTAPSTNTADTDAGASAGAGAGDDGDGGDGGSFIVNRECEMSACCGGEIESTEER